MKNGPKVENWWPIKALKCRFVHGEHVPMPDQLSLRRQSTALWRRHSLLGRHRRTSLLYVHVYVFHTTIRSLHGCPLDVFNLFNYGQLLVHSRALLSSQIACVICFIKLLVTNIRLIDWLICWFLFFCFILCFCTFVTIISPFELMRCIILLLFAKFYVLFFIQWRLSTFNKRRVHIRRSSRLVSPHFVWTGLNWTI